VKKRKMK
jgi:hypothetical protein